MGIISEWKLFGINCTMLFSIKVGGNRTSEMKGIQKVG
jgi:hypothetical protein